MSIRRRETPPRKHEAPARGPGLSPGVKGMKNKRRVNGPAGRPHLNAALPVAGVRALGFLHAARERAR